MPTSRRFSQRRRGTPRPMVWEECTRDQWLEHREHLLAATHAGQRPQGWWAYEAPEPRNPKIAECLQLHRIGVLSRAEIDALTPRWLEFEQKARTIGFFCEGPGKFLEGRAAYFAWRRWAGIPDDVIPPQANLDRVFKVRTDDPAAAGK